MARGNQIEPKVRLTGGDCSTTVASNIPLGVSKRAENGLERMLKRDDISPVSSLSSPSESADAQIESCPSAVSAATTQCNTPPCETDKENVTHITPVNLNTLSAPSLVCKSASGDSAGLCSSSTHDTNQSFAAVDNMERKLAWIQHTLQASVERRQHLCERNANGQETAEDQQSGRSKAVGLEHDQACKERDRLQQEYELLSQRMKVMEADNKQAKQELLQMRVSRNQLQKYVDASKAETKRAKEEILNIMREFKHFREQAASAEESNPASSTSTDASKVLPIPEAASEREQTSAATQCSLPKRKPLSMLGNATRRLALFIVFFAVPLLLALGYKLGPASKERLLPLIS